MLLFNNQIFRIDRAIEKKSVRFIYDIFILNQMERLYKQMNHSKSSILIPASAETVWNAITNDEKFSEWYAPGSKWSIPDLEVGKQVNFTLMPSAYNHLQEGESIPMNFVIKEMKTNRVFSLYRSVTGWKTPTSRIEGT